jgi:tetratricopeptide (TPR) repeat protein
MKRLHIPFEQNPTALGLGVFYSRGLNTWGGNVQRLGHPELAGEHFDVALQLNPENVAAAANVDFNKKARAGEHVPVGRLDQFFEHLGKYRNIQQVINDNGLFDEPTGCSAQGTVFSQAHLNRQAGQQFERVLTFVPDDLPARLWLGWIYLVSPMPEKALPLISDLKARSSSFADAGINPADVFRLEMVGYYVNKQPEKATHLIKGALAANPINTNLLGSIIQTSSSFGDFSNSLAAVEKQLELTPDGVNMLINAGYLNLQLSRYQQTIPLLTRALSLQPSNNAALFNRAIAYLRTDKLDEAQKDYEALEQANPKAYPVFYGLGEIAFRKKDTNAAAHYYQLYLANAPTNTDEAKSISERLKSLTGAQ